MEFLFCQVRRLRFVGNREYQITWKEHGDVLIGLSAKRHLSPSVVLSTEKATFPLILLPPSLLTFLIKRNLEIHIQHCVSRRKMNGLTEDKEEENRLSKTEFGSLALQM